MFKNFGIFAAVVIGILLGTYVKSWQCTEVSSNTNRLACILFKG